MWMYYFIKGEGGSIAHVDESMGDILKNKNRDAEKQKDKDPEQGPLDQPSEGLPFFFIHFLE